MPTRAELETAFERYQGTVRRARASNDWTLFADLFTERHVMIEFPVAWEVYDDERGWIICEIGNVMRDPGDGSVHTAPNTTILHYGGGNRFEYEEDVYNPINFAAVVAAWARIADAYGTLPDDGRAWLDRFAPGWSA